MNRRHMIQQSAAIAAGTAAMSLAAKSRADNVKANAARVRYCLNTSTIRGQKLTLAQEIDLASKAGYDGVEPWIREIRKHADDGGKLTDLRKRIVDTGLSVESAIGFSTWIVDDDAKRAEGFENMKRDMDVLRQIGGRRIAAPPVGATDQTDLNLYRAAERYYDLLELGKSMDVVPQLELWGFSKSLSRLGELIFVAVEAGHPQACLLPDVYHIYKGGSRFTGLELINGKSIHVLHMNDYPRIPREQIGDADRVYPGDGVAPLNSILTDLFAAGFSGALSLELFNRSYWEQEALQVARTGLEKMKSAVSAAQQSR